MARTVAEQQSLWRWALAGFAVFCGLAIFEIFVLRPGLGAPEELAGLAASLAPGPTWRFWLRIGGGAWSRGLMALALAPGGPWQSLYLFNLLALTGAAWGLWRLAKQLGGGEAAAFSLLFLYFAPFSFLQARTTFSYVPVPALLLGLVLALRRPQGRAASALLGLFAALAWLDYEAWILAAPVLALAWWTAPKASRARLLPLVAGLGLGCLLLVLAEAPYLRGWLFERGGSSGFGGKTGGLLVRLRGFFLGSSSQPALGLENLAAFPWLAWPGLMVGLVFAPTWLWMWAVCGLLGLCAGGPFMEPNRAIVAWPALLLISGLGSAWLWKRFASRLHPAWLGMGLLLAPLAGYAQFNQAIARWDAVIHGPSREVFQMAAFLEARCAHRRVALGPALEFQDTPLLARCLKGSSVQLETAPTDATGSGVELWFLVARDSADPSDPRWGRWMAFTAPGDSYPLYLLCPSPKAASFLKQAAGDLAAEQAVLSLSGPAQMVALAQNRASAPNAWSWSVWSGLLLRRALVLGKVSATDVLPLLQGPCLDSGPLDAIQGALGASQPKAAALAKTRERALQNPGRRWDLAFGVSN